jgi:hypothetical protein
VLKKSITYNDFEGRTYTEDFYFNLSKAELVELELSHKGGLSESLKRIVASEDGAEIIKEFKNIILKSYGQRSPDGKRFIKNQQLRDEFESTEAYSVLFIELVTDADAAALFVQGIMPDGLVDTEQLALVENPSAEAVEAGLPPAPTDEDTKDGELSWPPPGPTVPRKLTKDEIAAMDADDLKSGLASGRYEL